MSETKFLTQLSTGDFILDKNHTPAFLIVSFGWWARETVPRDHRGHAYNEAVWKHYEIDATTFEEAANAVPLWHMPAAHGFIVENDAGERPPVRGTSAKTGVWWGSGPSNEKRSLHLWSRTGAAERMRRAWAENFDLDHGNGNSAWLQPFYSSQAGFAKMVSLGSWANDAEAARAIQKRTEAEPHKVQDEWRDFMTKIAREILVAVE